MLGNVAKNIFLLGNKNVPLTRYNLTQAMLNNVRSKQFISSKDSSKDNNSRTTETDNIEDEIDDRPIQYSLTKAAKMRVDEYRDPYGDNVPWYQGFVVMISLATFLIYFCILREENDIDLMLYNNLGDTMKKQYDILMEQNQKLKKKT